MGVIVSFLSGIQSIDFHQKDWLASNFDVWYMFNSPL